VSESWLDRLTAGFRKTSDRLGDNMAGLFTRAHLDESLLDQIEEALIASDLGPATAAKVRARLAGETFETGLTKRVSARSSRRSSRRSLPPWPSRSRSRPFRARR
jgi:fused signal recognition particle receptor